MNQNEDKRENYVDNLFKQPGMQGSWITSVRPEIQEGIRRHIQGIGGLERVQILEISPGHAKLTVDVTPECLNLYGNVHGGFLFTLCDQASGLSAFAYEVKNVTQNASIQFLQGISAGTLYVDSDTIHKGRRTAVNQVKITDGQGKLIAVATMTMFLGDSI